MDLPTISNPNSDFPVDPDQPMSDPGIRLPSPTTETLDSSPAITADAAGVQTVVEYLPVDHSGTNVYVKGLVQMNSTKPALVFVHDIGENTRFYKNAANAFVERGYSVYRFDLHGHGRSGGSLGHVSSFSDYATDLLQVAAWVRFKSQGQAPIILGHGIGAVITIYFQLKFPRLCHAAVLSAPSLQLKWEVSGWQRFLIRRLANLVPRLHPPKSLIPNFTGTPYVGEGSLIHDLGAPTPALTVQAASELIRAIEWGPGRFLKFSANALVLCPDNDQVYSYDIISELLKRHKYREKITVRKLAAATHNALIESAAVVKSEVELIVNWIESLK